MDHTEKQRIIDEEHIKILSVVYFITSGLALVGAAFLFLYAAFFAVIFKNMPMMDNHNNDFNNNLPEEVFGIIVGILAVIAVIVLVYAILQFVSGWFLRKRKNRGFSFTIAIISLLSIPTGTIVGVFTLMVLSRPSVKQLYEENKFNPYAVKGTES